jgi:hypothetical protein
MYILLVNATKYTYLIETNLYSIAVSVYIYMYVCMFPNVLLLRNLPSINTNINDVLSYIYIYIEYVSPRW